MRGRWAVMGCVALALGIATPGIANAATSTDRPAGQAWVRVDGGTAYAKQKSSRQYRIMLPKGAKITWLGEGADGRTRSGTLGKKGLVAGWKRLGHGTDTTAYTTLLWREDGADRPDGVVAYVAKPRVNDSGQLTFLAKVGKDAVIPGMLPNFSVNVARADVAHVSRYPVTFSTFSIDKMDSTPTATTYAQATGDTAATVYTTCITSGTPTTTSVRFNRVNWLYDVPASTCGSVSISATMTDGTGSSVSLYIPYESSAQRNVLSEFGVIATGYAKFDFDQFIANWNAGGANPSPVG